MKTTFIQQTNITLALASEFVNPKRIPVLYKGVKGELKGEVVGYNSGESLAEQAKYFNENLDKLVFHSWEMIRWSHASQNNSLSSERIREELLNAMFKRSYIDWYGGEGCSHIQISYANVSLRTGFNNFWAERQAILFNKTRFCQKNYQMTQSCDGEIIKVF